MSRIGKRPVPLPSGVSATTEGQILSVKGPKGTLTLQMREEIKYDISEDGISVQPGNDTKQARAFWGMQRTLVQNLVTGVSTVSELEASTNELMDELKVENARKQVANVVNIRG